MSLAFFPPLFDPVVHPIPRPTFPSTCLSPDQPGYGQVVANAGGRRRPRRSTQSVTTSLHPAPHRGLQSGWTVVTPTSNMTQMGLISSRRNSPPIIQPSPSTPTARSRYLSDSHVYYQRSHDEREVALRHAVARSPSMHSLTSDSSVARDRRVYSRYAPYPGPSSAPSIKRRPSSRSSIVLDIPAMSLRDDPPNTSRQIPSDPIILAPIQPPSQGRSMSQSPYALPPISALEDLRGVSSQDSAAVLRRLQGDDDLLITRPAEPWARRCSLTK